MKKVTYGIPFQDVNRKRIESIIRATFRSYLGKNKECSLSRKDRERLMGQSKDQLTMYIKDMAGTAEVWSMSHNEIPFSVMTEIEVKRKSLLSVLDGEEVKNTFYQVKNTWYLGEDKDYEVISSDEFIKRVYSEIYDGAETAALYAIDSLFVVKERYNV